MAHNYTQNGFAAFQLHHQLWLTACYTAPSVPESTPPSISGMRHLFRAESLCHCPCKKSCVTANNVQTTTGGGFRTVAGEQIWGAVKSGTWLGKEEGMRGDMERGRDWSTGRLKKAELMTSSHRYASKDTNSKARIQGVKPQNRRELMCTAHKPAFAAGTRLLLCKKLSRGNLETVALKYTDLPAKAQEQPRENKVVC